MTQTTTSAIASRVRHLMKRKGWTADQLSKEMSRVGVAWNRSVTANVLTSRRRYVTVDELLALAFVLDVAPIHLLFPVDDDAEATRFGRSWIRGNFPLAGQDKRIFYSEVPPHEWKNPGADDDEYRALFDEDPPAPAKFQDLFAS